jgi:hypothetical protein
VQDASVDVAGTLPSNYRKFFGSCLTVELALVERIAKVNTYCVSVDSKQFRHLGLRRPRELADETHRKAHNATRR